MTRSELRALARTWCGDVSQPYAIPDPLMNQFLETAHQNVWAVAAEIWENYDLDKVVFGIRNGQEFYLLPDNCRGIDKIWRTDLSERVQVVPIHRHETWKWRQSSWGRTSTLRYYREGRRIGILPVPGETIERNLIMQYHRKARPLADEDDEPEIPSEHHQVVAAQAALDACLNPTLAKKLPESQVSILRNKVDELEQQMRQLMNPQDPDLDDFIRDDEEQWMGPHLVLE